jgi:hypothetical protein
MAVSYQLARISGLDLSFEEKDSIELRSLLRSFGFGSGGRGYSPPPPPTIVPCYLWQSKLVVCRSSMQQFCRGCLMPEGNVSTLSLGRLPASWNGPGISRDGSLEEPILACVGDRCANVVSVACRARIHGSIGDSLWKENAVLYFSFEHTTLTPLANHPRPPSTFASHPQHP